jgi:NADH:ubiquinone oxidoreductase subunit C
MKYKDNNLFDFLNYVLKNYKEESKHIKDYEPPVFLINRWLSMANDSFAKIINLTTNKWCTKTDIDIKKFYKVLLPKHTKRITYIKKTIKEKDIVDSIQMANLLECSIREIEMFNETLAQFSNHTK